jgi:hypothetical protein
MTGLVEQTVALTELNQFSNPLRHPEKCGVIGYASGLR